jgi:hypothetical protein
VGEGEGEKVWSKVKPNKSSGGVASFLVTRHSLNPFFSLPEGDERFAVHHDNIFPFFELISHSHNPLMEWKVGLKRLRNMGICLSIEKFTQSFVCPADRTSDAWKSREGAHISSKVYRMWFTFQRVSAVSKRAKDLTSRPQWKLHRLSTVSGAI